MPAREAASRPLLARRSSTSCMVRSASASDLDTSRARYVVTARAVKESLTPHNSREPSTTWAAGTCIASAVSTNRAWIWLMETRKARRTWSMVTPAWKRSVAVCSAP